jgi:ABC-2 type transport system permease protein
MSTSRPDAAAVQTSITAAIDQSIQHQQELDMSTPTATTDPTTLDFVSVTSHTEPRRGRVRLIDVARGEWIKFRSVRSTWFTLPITAVVAIGLGMVFTATAESGEIGTARAALLDGPVELALGAVDLAAMIIGVLGVVLVAGEYATGLIRTTFAAVGSRVSVLIAKAGVLGVVAAITAAVTAIGALWLGQAVYAGDGATIALTSADGIGVILGTTAYLTGIGLIGLALGTMLRSTASAIGALVGSIFIAPPLVALLPDVVTDAVLRFLPSQAGSAMMATVSDPELLSTGDAYLVLAAWVIGLLTIAAVLLHVRDA